MYHHTTHSSQKRTALAILVAILLVCACLFGGLSFAARKEAAAADVKATATFKAYDPIAFSAITKNGDISSVPVLTTASPGDCIILLGTLSFVSPSDSLGWGSTTTYIAPLLSESNMAIDTSVAKYLSVASKSDVSSDVAAALTKIFPSSFNSRSGIFEPTAPPTQLLELDAWGDPTFNSTTYSTFNYANSLSTSGSVYFGTGTGTIYSYGTASKHSYYVCVPLLISEDFTSSSGKLILGEETSGGNAGANRVGICGYNSSTGVLAPTSNAETYTAETGRLAVTPAVLTVGESSKSTEANLLTLKAGNGTSAWQTLSVSSTMSYGTTEKLNTFWISLTSSASSTVTAWWQANPSNVMTLKADGSQESFASNPPPSGNALLHIKVTAEDGSHTNEYVLNVTNGTALLESLAVSSTTPTTGLSGMGLQSTFNAATKTYDVYVPSDATATTVTPRVDSAYGVNETMYVSTTNCSALSTVASGRQLAVSGIQDGATIKFTATSGDGKNTADYTLTFHVRSVDTSLNVVVKDGSATGTQLTNTGTSTAQSYKVTSANGNTAYVELSVATSSKMTLDNVSTTSPYTNTYSLGSGNKTLNVTVTAQAGNSATYTVTLNQDVVGAEFTKLEISYGGGSYTDITSTVNSTGGYTGNLSLDTYSPGAKVDLRYTVPSGGTVTAGTGLTSMGGSVLEGTLAYGQNTYTLSVTGTQSSTPQTYTITVNLYERKNGISNVTSTHLSGLSFNSATQTYNLTVPYETTQVILNATLEGIYETLGTGGKSPVDTSTSGQIRTLTYSLSTGTNSFTLTGVSDANESGKVYTFNITREAGDSDTSLGNLVITQNGTPVNVTPTGSNPSNPSGYKVTLDDLDVPVGITAVPNGEKATVTATIGGQEVEIPTVGSNPRTIDLSQIPTAADGTKTVTVTVTAQDGTKETHTITFAGPDYVPDSSYEIIDIQITGNDGQLYFYSFVKSQSWYEVTVPYSVNIATFSVTTSSDTATVKVVSNMTRSNTSNNDVNLMVGSNSVKVYAYAEDGTNIGASEYYDFTIIRSEAVKEALLTEILIDGGLVSGFDPHKFTYTHFVPFDGALISRLDAIAEEEFATIVMSVNGVHIDTNRGSITDVASVGEVGEPIVITFEVSIDDASSTYVLTLIRASEVPVLSYLSVTGSNGNYKIYDEHGVMIDGTDPLAVAYVYDFYSTIDYRDTTVVIDARTSTENAELRIKNDGYFSVSELFGNKATATVQIAITPEAGDVAVYYVHLTREAAPTSNTNAGIIIHEIDQFNKEYAENNFLLLYGAYYVPYNVASLTIDVILERESELVAPGTYQIFYDDVLKSDNGIENANVHLNYDCNIVTIKILASDGLTSRTVIVHVYREYASLLSANIREIEEFHNDYDASVTDYAYSVGNDVKDLHIDVLVGEGLTYEIVGDSNLKYGLNSVYIYLYEIQDQGVSRTAAGDSANAVRTITINVFRESEGISTVWLILFILFLILAVIEGIIIICLLLRRKNENNTRVTVNAPTPVPAPIVRYQAPVAAPVQYVAVQPQPQPQVSYLPTTQPAEKNQPVNVEVKITGCGDSDGVYKSRK